MIFQTSPVKILIIGIACVVLGFILPFIIVAGVIPNTLGLSFLIFILQIVGLILGVISTGTMVMRRRKAEEEDKKAEKDDWESTTGWMK